MSTTSASFGMRLPFSPDEYWTDAAIASLIGQEIEVNFNGVLIPFLEDGDTVRITDAKRYVDEALGEGVWIECEAA